jgi:hypothetical protein
MLYESYIHPITILSTLPSAGVGALLMLILLIATPSRVLIWARSKQQAKTVIMPGAQEGKPITQGLQPGKARENAPLRDPPIATRAVALLARSIATLVHSRNYSFRHRNSFPAYLSICSTCG